MLPVIAIVGYSKSGKTTLVEKLVRDLTDRGYRIATIKDSHRQPVFDTRDKDSWRHIQAGSILTALCTNNQVVCIHPQQQITIDRIMPLMGNDFDLVIAEGFKEDEVPKIEVHRCGRPLLKGVKRLVAIATEEPLERKVRQFDINDVRSIADLLERGYISPNRERIALYINTQPVILKAFPRDMIKGVVTNMLSSLKGVSAIKNIQLLIKTGNR